MEIQGNSQDRIVTTETDVRAALCRYVVFHHSISQLRLPCCVFTFCLLHCNMLLPL